MNINGFACSFLNRKQNCLLRPGNSPLQASRGARIGGLSFPASPRGAPQDSCFRSARVRGRDVGLPGKKLFWKKKISSALISDLIRHLCFDLDLVNKMQKL